MKRVYYILFANVLVVLSGCRPSEPPIYYDVCFENIGNVDIYVESTILYKSNSFSSTLGGELVPSSPKSSGPYTEKPFETLKVEWHQLKTPDKAFSKTISTKLPDGITYMHVKNITVYIDPNMDRVYVAYEVQRQDGSIQEITPTGKPFSVESVKHSDVK